MRVTKELGFAPLRIAAAARGWLTWKGLACRTHAKSC